MSRSKSSSKNNNTYSLKPVQIKLDIKELKDILMNETLSSTNKSTLYNHSRKKSDYKNSYDSICININTHINKTPKSSKTTHHVLKKMFELQKGTNNTNQETLDEKKYQLKDKIALHLYDELNSNLNEHSTLKVELQNVQTIRSEHEKKKNKVIEYCDKVKQQFQSYIKIIDGYENNIKVLKKEREEIIKSNDEIIENLLNERNILLKELDKYNNKCDFHDKLIVELKSKKEIRHIENNNQGNGYSEFERVEQIQYDKLNQKYQDLLIKSQEYQIFDDEREEEHMSTQSKYKKEKIQKENKHLKLKDCQLKNDFLKKRVEEINSKLKNTIMKSEPQQSNIDKIAYGKQNFFYPTSNSMNISSSRNVNYIEKCRSQRLKLYK